MKKQQPKDQTPDQRGEEAVRIATRTCLRVTHVLRQNPDLSGNARGSCKQFNNRVEILVRARRVHRELAKIEQDLAAYPLDARDLYQAMRLRLDRILSKTDLLNEQREAA